MNRRIARLVACACIAATTSGAAFAAGSTATEISATRAWDDICIGDWVGYTVQVQGSDQVVRVKWEYQFQNCDPAGPVWPGSSMSRTIGFWENSIGTCLLTATVTFRDFRTMTEYTSTVSKTYDILPPNNVVMIEPASIPPEGIVIPTVAAAPPTYPIKFEMRRGARKLYISNCTIYEKITRSPYGRIPDQNWFVPPYISNPEPGIIVDMKGVLADLDYLTTAPGTDVDKLDQRLGVLLPRGCGGHVLGQFSQVFKFTMKKEDDSHWKLLTH